MKTFTPSQIKGDDRKWYIIDAKWKTLWKIATEVAVILKWKNKVSFTRPKVIDLLYFAQGYGVDGVFAISIVLILARDVSLNAALMGGSALLAMRHVGEAIAAPIFGFIADKVGANLVFALSTLATIMGFYFVAAGFTISGALTMLIFRGALASLGPAVIAQSTQDTNGPLQLFAKMQNLRSVKCNRYRRWKK